MMASEALSDREMVTEFHVAFGLPIRLVPAQPDIREQDLRLALLEEECLEVRKAVLFKDLPNLAKELADVIYVAHGTALAYGIPLQKVMQLVHRSNMAKLGPDGPILRHDGKIMKPEGWTQPDMASLLADYGWEPDART